MYERDRCVCVCSQARIEGIVEHGAWCGVCLYVRDVCVCVPAYVHMSLQIQLTRLASHHDPNLHYRLPMLLNMSCHSRPATSSGLRRFARRPRTAVAMVAGSAQGKRRSGRPQRRSRSRKRIRSLKMRTRWKVFRKRSWRSSRLWGSARRCMSGRGGTTLTMNVASAAKLLVMDSTARAVVIMFA